MAQVGMVPTAGRRPPPIKRRMSRDVVLPDISNLPGKPGLGEKVARRPQHELEKVGNPNSAPEKQERVTFDVDGKGNQRGTTAPVVQNRHGRVAFMGENKGHNPCAKEHKPKPKSTPFVAGRKKKRQPKMTVEIPELCVPVKEEMMEIENPSLVIRSIQNRVPREVTDIDDHMDPMLSPEYAQDIINYMQARENQVSLPYDFLDINPEVTSQMRAILVDWLIQVQSHEQMEDETLQLAVRIIDHYLASAEVPLTKLQLVGITGILIAAKFIERFPPAVETLCTLTAGTYVAEEVLEMERDVLRVLKFDVSHPLPQFFLDRYIHVHAHDPRVELLALYLIDLSLPSVHFVPVAPSKLAASALYVARRVYQVDNNDDSWTLALAYYTKYTERDLATSVKLLAKVLLRAAASKYQGARQKHSGTGVRGAISLDPLLENHPGLLEIAGDKTKTGSFPTDV